MLEKIPAAPHWSGRIPKWKVARIYDDDASGMCDEDLLNDVAFTLLARCKSMLVVEEARQGRAPCPVCETIVEHAAKKGCLLDCDTCDWSGSWDDYRSSYKGRHLIAPGLQPFFREYVRRIIHAATPKEKMYWIDWLVHRCHWEGTALPGQPGAVCLIQGRASDVNEFLSALTAGTHRSKSTGDLTRHWSPAKKEQIIKWRAASDRRKRKRS